MNLKLNRPIAIFDLETTGTNITQDRIVEIAIAKILPDGTKTVKRKLLNPEMPIPPSVSEIHGITDEMVQSAPTFKQVANEIKQFFDNCDLCGFNCNKFDVPILVEEFLRAGLDFELSGRKMIDVQKIFHTLEQRTLTAAYKFYCDKVLEGAHSAEVDVNATWEVLDAQIARYEQLGNTIESILACIGDDQIVDLARRFVRENGIEKFNFGKHKGKPVLQVLKEEPQYYDWMMKGDFPRDTKNKLSEIYQKSLLKK